MKTTQNAVPEDFTDPVLHDPPFGIFQQVDLSPPIMAALLPDALVITYDEKGDIVFDQKDLTDGKIRAILSGTFSIKHTVLDESHEICVDQPGIALSDVELFVRGVDAKEFGRGQTGHNFATVECAEAGRVLEFNPTPLLGDAAFILNLGRQVSTKLLRRNAASDKRFLKESKQVAYYLRQIIMNRRDEIGPNKLVRSQARHYYLAGITYAEVARAAGLGDETVRRFALRLQERSQEFSWKDHSIEMSRDFYEKLTAEGGAAYLCRQAAATKKQSNSKQSNG